MPQWRKLHVKTTESHDLNDMPDDFTRLMWVLMPLGLDSAGRGMDDSSWLKSKLFPLRRDISFQTIEQSMTWYADRCMIIRYEVDGRSYFFVPTFAKYQGKTDREAASLIPDPVKPTKRSRSRPTHDLLTTKSSSDAEVDSDAEESGGAGAHPPESKNGRLLPAPIKTFIDSGGKFKKDKREKAIAFILENVKDTPESLALWARVVDGYTTQWSAFSYTVMVNDYYLQGRIPGQRNINGAYRQPATQPQFEKVVTAADIPSIEVSPEQHAKARAMLEKRLGKK